MLDSPIYFLLALVGPPGFSPRRIAFQLAPSKAELRQELRARRATHVAWLGAWNAGWWQGWRSFVFLRRLQQKAQNRRLEARLWRILSRIKPCTIAGFYPLPGEPNLLPLLLRLHRQGWRVCLPRVEDAPQRRAMDFHAWDPKAPLESSRYTIPQPLAQAEILRPDILLLPMLGFDRHGMRLGMGKGHYDATIAAFHILHHRPLLIGIAYDYQEVPMIPPEAHDVPLPVILTPSRRIQPTWTPMGT